MTHIDIDIVFSFVVFYLHFKGRNISVLPRAISYGHIFFIKGAIAAGGKQT